MVCCSQVAIISEQLLYLSTGISFSSGASLSLVSFQLTKLVLPRELLSYVRGTQHRRSCRTLTMVNAWATDHNAVSSDSIRSRLVRLGGHRARSIRHHCALSNPESGSQIQKSENISLFILLPMSFYFNLFYQLSYIYNVKVNRKQVRGELFDTPLDPETRPLIERQIEELKRESGRIFLSIKFEFSHSYPCLYLPVIFERPVRYTFLTQWGSIFYYFMLIACIFFLL